jgi:hypothetical protein
MVQRIMDTEKLAFTVRLTGKERETYEKYKNQLAEKIPNVSHSQTIAILLKEIDTSP